MSEEPRLLKEIRLQGTHRRHLSFYLPVSVVNLFGLKPHDLAKIFYDKKQDHLVLKFPKAKEKRGHAKA
jgi:hypothetical protein